MISSRDFCGVELAIEGEFKHDAAVLDIAAECAFECHDDRLSVRIGAEPDQSAWRFPHFRLRVG